MNLSQASLMVVVPVFLITIASVSLSEQDKEQQVVTLVNQNIQLLRSRSDCFDQVSNTRSALLSEITIMKGEVTNADTMYRSMSNQYANLSWVCSTGENPMNIGWEDYNRLRDICKEYGCVDEDYLKNSSVIDWNTSMLDSAEYCATKDRFDQVIFCLSDTTRAQLNYTPGFPDLRPATELNGVGDCTDYAKLFCAYARSIGMPCRVVLGRGVNTTDSLHQWSEVQYFTDGSYGWVVIDATERANSTSINDSPDPFSSQGKYILTKEETW